jgi:DinB superfamily
MNRAPDQSEYAEYYRTYTSQVPAGNIVQTLEAQALELNTLLGGISEARSMHRYAPDKWTIREVASHINDTERVFGFRAFWFARVLGTDLPSFDQDAAIPTSGANDRSWASHVEEFKAVRAATMAFWKDLPADAWDRRGIASGNPFSVRSLAWITAGHVTHHARLLRERYL